VKGKVMKEYLGDSVYAEFDGYQITLTTENDLANDPSNTIFLEPAVVAALQEFIKKVKGG
jgi:hypothetical protein